jgi:hypothetical protein
MWIGKEPLDFIKTYLDAIEDGLKEENHQLSYTQKMWLGFCLMGILLTNSICWAKFSRISFRSYTHQALSWMFRHAKFPWERLLIISTRMILKKFGIQNGILIIDDKDIPRSKNAKYLFRLHKFKDKKTSGYCLGQNIVLLYFVNNKISIPVGFAFYSPDPEWKKWEQEIKELKNKRIDKSLWPKKPERSKDHPKKYELAITLLNEFKKRFSQITVHTILSDCLYGHASFIEEIYKIWKGMQVITKMRKKQKIQYGNKEYSCEEYSHSYKGWQQQITLRGRTEQAALMGGGRLYVSSHKAKRWVIALKYEGSKEYRYLMATNLTWNMKEIAEIFTLRWLIEVFFEDWSMYNGFCSLAKQCDEDGSLRPLTLSLLFDHCFLFHTDQSSRIDHAHSLATFGTLLEKSRAMALCHFIQQIIEDNEPKEKLKTLIESLDDIFPLRQSKKHLSGISIKMEPMRHAA